MPAAIGTSRCELGSVERTLRCVIVTERRLAVRRSRRSGRRFDEDNWRDYAGASVPELHASACNRRPAGAECGLGATRRIYAMSGCRDDIRPSGKPRTSYSGWPLG